MTEIIFVELSVILFFALVISTIVRFLKQPLLIGYIITGVIVGPYFLNIIKSPQLITTFAQIGVSLLLFIVGLNISPKVLKEVGSVSLITGVGQVLFTSLIGFLIAKLLGFATLPALYISVALTFSSTIIIMKLLSDKKDLETLYGKISMGLLIVQDLIALMILIILPSISKTENLFQLISYNFIAGAFLLISLLLVGNYILPSLMNIISKSQELLLLFSLSWCLILSTLFYYFNFTIEMGAFLAGITLSLSPYHYEIGSRMKPLRDFFILLFFILIGTQMRLENITPLIIPMIAFSVFILIGNPLIVMIIMCLIGYTKRNSFLAGLNVAQISEFSLILITLGVKLGHLKSDILALVTFVGVITIGLSTYLILYSEKIYLHISKYLSIFERKGKKVDEYNHHTDKPYNILLFGCHRSGSVLLNNLKKKEVLIIDYNPKIIEALAEKGYECRYGDAGDYELLDEIDFSKPKTIISTINDLEANILLLKKIKEKNTSASIIISCKEADEALKLYEKGASYVILPDFLGGRQISWLLKKKKSKDLLKERKNHISEIKRNKIIFVEHPKDIHLY
ncbi:cation:proton antiporter [archaeon]|nr:cation:proton antiporter [archaeon]